MAIEIVRFDNFIFDLDGTLIDSAPGIQAAVEYTWNSLYPDKPVPDVRQSIGPPIIEIFRNLIPQASNEEIDQMYRLFREAYDRWGWKMTQLFDDVTPFLNLLQRADCHCFGVTNKPSLPTRRILHALDIEQKFLTFLSPDLLDHPFSSKSEAIQQLLKEYRLVKQNTVMVGDFSEDAKAAYLTGVAFIYRNHDPHKALLPGLSNSLLLQ